jgi:hypothetical protein
MVALLVALHRRGHVLAELLARRTARANPQRSFHEGHGTYEVGSVQGELQRYEAAIRVPDDVRAPHTKTIQ